MPANAGDLEIQVPSLGGEDTLEEGMATHCSILAWRIPWTEEPCGILSMELQRVRQLKHTQGHLKAKPKGRRCRENLPPLRAINKGALRPLEEGSILKLEETCPK